ncbi:unnamed protein product [Soboliphyme baturini]|uniref:BBC domain-containing protein n=1 Tax=Soboliphyme baturini TaxID=241478 RepID=A0A183IWV2_9BILA|nr:unnamed protein product [Soboliphyme baturini]
MMKDNMDHKMNYVTRTVVNEVSQNVSRNTSEIIELINGNLDKCLNDCLEKAHLPLQQYEGKIDTVVEGVQDLREKVAEFEEKTSLDKLLIATPCIKAIETYVQQTESMVKTLSSDLQKMNENFTAFDEKVSSYQEKVPNTVVEQIVSSIRHQFATALQNMKKQFQQPVDDAQNVQVLSVKLNAAQKEVDSIQKLNEYLKEKCHRLEAFSTLAEEQERMFNSTIEKLSCKVWQYEKIFQGKNGTLNLNDVSSVAVQTLLGPEEETLIPSEKNPTIKDLKYVKMERTVKRLSNNRSAFLQNIREKHMRSASKVEVPADRRYEQSSSVLWPSGDFRCFAYLNCV